MARAFGRGALVVLSVLVAAVGCGGTQKFGPSCGAGTVERNGECVIADVHGQDDSSVQDADPRNDAPADTATTDSPDVSQTDVSADTATSSDDECPPLPINVNCSGTCGGPSSCASASCGTSAIPVIDKYSQLPFVMRTPSMPGVDAKCAGNCGDLDPSKTPDFGVSFNLQLPYVKTGVHVLVGAPWEIHTWFYRPFCEETPSMGQCVGDANGAIYLISTHDPNAPARNIIVAENDPDAGSPCQ